MATPTSAVRGIEAAIRALVIADSTFTTRCPGGLTSHEDEEQVYPFVLFHDSLERSWNTLGGPDAGFGHDVTIRMHVYSHYRGDREALLILERLVELLNFTTLTVSGYASVLIEYAQSKVLIEAREKLETRHIPVEFRVRVHTS